MGRISNSEAKELVKYVFQAIEGAFSPEDYEKIVESRESLKKNNSTLQSILRLIFYY